MALAQFCDHPLTAGFEPDELRYLERIAEPFEFIGGSTLCIQDEASPGLLLVEHGRLRVSQRSQDGQEELTITELTSPTVVGEMELLSGSPSVCTVTAVEAGTGHRITPVRFQRLLGEGPTEVTKLVRNIAKVLVKRLMESNRRYLSVVDPSEYHSLAEALTGYWSAVQQDGLESGDISAG